MVDQLENLPDDDLEILLKRAEQEENTQQKEYNRPDYFETFPKAKSAGLKEYLHEQIRHYNGLPEGVRAYKRNVAVVVQAIAAMNYETWGFVLYRTTYKNESAWEDFMTQFKSINDGNIAHPNKGQLLEVVADGFEVMLATDGEVGDGASFQDCIE